MTLVKRIAPASALVAFFVLVAGCGDNKVTAPGPKPGAAPDFQLSDVNPASATYGLRVSPRRYLGQISAYYFGHAT